MIGQLNDYKPEDGLVKSVKQAMQAFKTKYGYNPSMVEVRDDEYDPSKQTLPIQAIVVHQRIQSKTFILYPVVMRQPVRIPERRFPI